MSDRSMPTGRIGNVTISRLIIGGNQFSGWSHSRDLKYLRELFKAYATEAKIMDTLQLAEENGINTIITSSSGYLSKYWKERGGQIQWIAQVHPKTDDVTSDIKRAIDGGAIGAYVQGGVGDSFVKGGRVDLLGKAVEFIKANRLIAGIGGHSIEVPIAVEKASIQPDFYMKTLHHDNYWSATPKEERVEFNVDSNGPNDHDNIWSITPEKDYRVHEGRATVVDCLQGPGGRGHSSQGRIQIRLRQRSRFRLRRHVRFPGPRECHHCPGRSCRCPEQAASLASVVTEQLKTGPHSGSSGVGPSR